MINSAKEDGKWLILEHAEDRESWGLDTKPSGLVLGKSHFIRESPRFNHILSEGEICVVFLPTSYRTDILPAAFKDVVGNDIKVWCHYGRNIPGIASPDRWKEYGRLSVVDKEAMFPDGQGQPAHFSRNQTLEWSLEFEEIKRTVSELCLGRKTIEEAWGNTQVLLERAWKLANKNMEVHRRVSGLMRVFPGFLSAQSILATLPMDHMDVTAAGFHSFLEVYRNSEFRSLVETCNLWDSEVDESIREKVFAVVDYMRQTKEMLDNGTLGQPSKVPAKHMSAIRASLERFVEYVKSQSLETSEILCTNPRLLRTAM